MTDGTMTLHGTPPAHGETMTLHEMDTTTPSRCIQVRRSDTGTYEIPGAATEEVWQEVRSHMEEVEHHGDLCGWKPWTRVYRCVDEHGDTRWYFVQ